MTQFLILAHVGGTKARFGLRETSSNRLDEFLYKSRYPIGFFQNSTTMIEHFIQEARDSLEYRPGKINLKEITPKNIKVCLALAGPVDNNQCNLVNWNLNFDGQLLKQKLGFQEVDLINDFQAVAYGVRELRKLEKDFHDFNFYTLQEAVAQENGLIAVIGVATGLGKSFLIQASDEKEVYAYATEGGHVNFAPSSPFEFALFQYILNNIQDENHCLLKDSYNRISVERLVSGRGILTIYRFLQDCQNDLDKNAWLQKLPDRFKNEVKKIKEELQSLKGEVVKSNLDNLEKSGKYPLSQIAQERISQKYQDSSLSLSDFLKELEKILEKELEINSKQEQAKKKQEIIDKFSEPQAIEQLITIWIKEDNRCSEPVDPAAVIASAAISKSDPLCIYTMQTFLKITAAVLGNCALHFLPDGGLYLAGGIPPQILPLIEQHKKTITDAFSQKGRLIDELTKIPIHVVKNLEAGLIGAAYYAEHKM